MISRTKQITELVKRQPDFSLPVDKTFAIFNEPRYLLIDSRLREFSCGRIKNVLNRATLLSREATALSDQYAAIQSDLDKKQIAADEVLDTPEWDLLRGAQEMFDSRWSEFFVPAQNAAELDRVGIRNALAAPEVRALLKRLNSRQPEKIRSGIQRLRDHILEQAQRSVHLRAVFFDTEATILEGSSEHPITSLFDVLRLANNENDGRPLSACEVSDRLETIQESEVADKHDIRVVVRCRFVGGGTPFLAVDSWLHPEQSSTRWVGVAWRHQSDAVTLWREGLTFFARMRGVLDIGSEARCSIHMAVGDELKTVHISSVAGQLPSHLSKLHSCESFELRAGELVFLADVKPLESSEYQANVQLPYSNWSAIVTKAVAPLISRTRELKISNEHYVEILEYVFRKLHVGTVGGKKK